jgi:hypothetical protein
MKIYTIIILCILSYSLFMIFRYNTGSCVNIIAKGYGVKDDSIETLLDRIQYSNHYPAKRLIKHRYALYSVIIAFLTSIVYSPKLDSRNMLQAMIIIWLILICCHSFFNHHSDKFTSYFIDNNIKYIREKLKINSSINILKVNKRGKFPGNHDCSTFVYKNFDL